MINFADKGPNVRQPSPNNCANFRENSLTGLLMSVGGEYSDTAVVVPGGDMVTVCNVHHSTLARDRSAAACNTNSINILVTQ